MARAYRKASQQLYDLAEGQQGYFTTKQAKAAGFKENTHPYHLKAGNWIREHRGIYRLAHFPVADRSDLVLWALWSRNRNETEEGVYSHHTAASLYELSDLNPAKLHMTVPTKFRRNSEIPSPLKLHCADLPSEDVQVGSGYRYTRPLRTILDLIDLGTVQQEYILQAVRQATDRGILTVAQIRNRKMSETARETFDAALRTGY